MSKHNILFYSSHPNDELSKEILNELNKNHLLKEQYVTICVNSPGIKLPRMITENNEVPVIVTRGFDKPISGEAALSLIREANSGKAGGLDYGDPEKAGMVSEDHGVLANESGRTSYHQPFNEDWNQGAENDTRTLNSAFAEYDQGFEQNTVDTYEEKGRGTKGLKTQLDRKLRQRNFQRMKEVPPPLQRVGAGGAGGAGGMPLNASVGGGLGPNMGGFPPQLGGREQFPPPMNPMMPHHSQAQMTPQQQHPYAPNGVGEMGHMPGAGGRGDMRFPPPPVQNPLYPPPRSGQQQPQNVPQLPPGFGQMNNSHGGISANSRAGAASSGGSDFSTFEGAFSGQSLMGTPMQSSKFGSRGVNEPKRRGGREQMMSMGLPTGRGHAGPYGSMMNTSSY